MKTRFSFQPFQRMIYTLLMIAIMGFLLAIPGQAISAKPLAGTFTGCVSQAQIPVAECNAVVTLHNGTNGPGWLHNTGWLQTDTPCSWYAVGCTTGHITSLSLSWNQLSGPIPTELGNLTHLENLALSGNALSGPIPTELGNLTSITHLALASNQLTGPIPTQLGSLTQFNFLDLSSNHLNGSIPAQLGNLTNLHHLDLSGNELIGSIPKPLGNPVQLEFLNLGDNQLTGSIPVRLGELVNLTELDLSDNALSGSIPTELGSLANLTDLYLGNNQLTGEIPASFTNLASLTNLTLSCGLTSTNPTVISFIDGILGPGWDMACPPVNDDFGSALVISSSPYSNTQDTSLTTTALDDPSFPCGSQDQGTNSIWYSYTPASAGLLTLDTIGSDYDTMLAVWTGSSGSLVNIGCNDDGSGVQSQLAISVAMGQTYSIEVAGYSDSGALVLNAVFTIPLTPTPTVTPTSTITPTPTITSTRTITTAPTITPTSTITVTPTITTTSTVTVTPTITRTRTPGTPIILTQTLTSIGANDGWILETGQSTSKGGTLNSTATTFYLGDDALNKQYLGILHFNTTLPVGAVVTSATLKIKKSGLVGTDPFNTLGGLLVDIRKPFFGTTINLVVGDFQATASKPAVATFGKTPINSWYSATLSAAGIPFINTAGTTQFRLRFKQGDNSNNSPNYVTFFSGNGPAASRPQLIIQYHIP